MAKTVKNAYTLGQDTMTNWGNVESQFMNELRKKPTAAANPAELGNLRVGGHSFSTLPEASRQKILGWASSPDFKSTIVDNSQNTVVPPLGAEPAAPAQPASVNTAGIAAKAATDALSAPSAYDVGTTSKYAEWAAKPLQRKFDEQVSGLNREAMSQGLWWSGTRGEALGRSVEDYSRGLAEDVIVPLTYKAMEGRANEAQARLDAAIRAGASQADVERLANDADIARKELGLRERETTLREGQAIGQVKIPSLSAKDLGVDTSQYLNPDGSVKSMDAFNTAAEAMAAQAKQVLGRDLTPDEARTLARGGSLSNVFAATTDSRKIGLETGIAVGEVGGQKTVEERKNFGFDRQVTKADGTVSTEHVYGANEIDLMLQNDRQSFEEKAIQGWDYVNEKGETRHVMGRDEAVRDRQAWEEHQRVGYDKIAYGPDGQPIVDATGKVVMQHVEGTQEAENRLRSRALDLQKEGMSLDDAFRQAQLEQTERFNTGYYKVRSVKWGDLALGEMPNFVRPDGSVDIAAFNAWAGSPAGSQAYNTLSKAIGRPPSAQDVQQIIQGQAVAVRDGSGQPVTDWIEGNVGLEEAKNNLARDLQQKGFDHDTATRIAENAQKEKEAAGYWHTDATTGEKAFVRGTQGQAEYMARLQSELGLSELDARARIDRENRVGYDQVMEFTRADGTKYSKAVHVMGTQELEVAQRNGGYITRMDANGKPYVDWINGDQAHQKAMQDDAQALVEKGWAHDDAVDAVRNIRSRATAKSGVIKNDFITSRMHQYMNGPEKMDEATARAKAEGEWTAVESSLGEPMEERLQRMGLDAAKELRDDEHRWQMQAAAIAAIGSIAQDLGAVGVAKDALKGVIEKAFGVKFGDDEDFVDVIADWADVAEKGGKEFDEVVADWAKTEGDTSLGTDATSGGATGDGIGNVGGSGLGTETPANQLAWRDGVTFSAAFKGFVVGGIAGGVSAWSGDSEAMQRWATEHPNLAAGKTGLELAGVYEAASSLAAKGGAVAAQTAGVFAVATYIGANYLVRTFKSPGDRSATTASMGQLDTNSAVRLMPPELKGKTKDLTNAQEAAGFQVTFDWVDGKVYFENQGFKGGRDPEWSEPIDQYLARNQMMVIPVDNDLVKMANTSESRDYMNSFNHVVDREMGGKPKDSKYAFVFPDGLVVYRDGRGKITGRSQLPASYTTQTTAKPLGQD